MNLLTLLRFQFGASAAIESAARNSSALPVAVAQVLLTAVARNYNDEQTRRRSRDFARQRREQVHSNSEAA